MRGFSGSDGLLFLLGFAIVNLEHIFFIYSDTSIIISKVSKKSMLDSIYFIKAGFLLG